MLRTMMLAIILSLLNVGCAGHRLVDPGVASEKVLMLEQGKQKEFYAVGVGWEAWTPGDAARGYRMCLVENEIKPTANNIQKAYEESPPWRRMSSGVQFDLFTLAVVVNGGEALLAAPEGSVAWIVGNNPVIIARGTRLEKTRAWGGSVGNDARVGGTFRLVTARDLDEQITEIRFLDEWPPTPASYLPNAPYRESVSDSLGKPLKPKIRVIKPPQGMTLRQLRDRPMW